MHHITAKLAVYSTNASCLTVINVKQKVLMMLDKLVFTLKSIHEAYLQGETVESVLNESLKRLSDTHDEGIYLYLASKDQLLHAISELGEFNIEEKPLWGIPFAVKDNIDVYGMPTTAGCEAFAYYPESDSHVVSLLKKAGAIVVGKTNLDQFATGLVGVRTPFVAPKNAIDPSIVPGGSSSGSAVAVSHGQVCFSLGTDTAGSGRVPAALNNIVGLKPTLGSISASGVVPACRTLDTVSIFSQSVSDASAVFKVCCSYDNTDAFSKPIHYKGLSAPDSSYTLGVPDAKSLIIDEPALKDAYEQSLAYLRENGAKLVEVDFQPFYDVAKLLYEGPWVAERFAAIETFMSRHPDSLHPTTEKIIGSARNFSASDAFKARYQLEELRKEISPVIDSVDAFVVPSIPGVASVAELENNAIAPNSRLGIYTNFVNLLDLCAIAVPGVTRHDGFPSSVTFIAKGGHDAYIHALANDFHLHQAELLGATEHKVSDLKQTLNEDVAVTELSAKEMAIAVVGAHMQGFPLNHQLTNKGGRFLKRTNTAPNYRLFKLGEETPLRPGLLKVDDGHQIELEVWAIPKSKFGDLLSEIPSPLSIGSIILEDKQLVKGFLCESHAIKEATDISHFGGWREFCKQK